MLIVTIVFIWFFSMSERTPKNWCFWTAVMEKTHESLLDCKEIKPVHIEENQSWIFLGRTDDPILWPPDRKNWFIRKDPDAGKKLKAGGKVDDRGWEGWMTSPTQWTWIWASSGSWEWTGKPGVLQSMGSQRVGHDWVTELNWIECLVSAFFYFTNLSLSAHGERCSYLTM